MGQWSKTSSVSDVRPEREGHQWGLFGPMSPSHPQSLNTKLLRLPSSPSPVKAVEQPLKEHAIRTLDAVEAPRIPRR